MHHILLTIFSSALLMCVQPVLQQHADHPLIAVHEKVAQTLGLENCWICRELSRHPSDPIGLYETPVPIQNYAQGKGCLISNVTWDCGEGRIGWYPRCTILPNIQAQYQVSPTVGNKAEDNAFPVCIKHHVSGCNPASRYLGYLESSKCPNILEFDDTTGNWKIRDRQLVSRNWTAKVQGKQVNYTLHYWNITIAGETLLVTPDGLLYDPLIEQKYDYSSAPNVISKILEYPLWSARCSYMAPWANVTLINSTWIDYKWCDQFQNTYPEGVGLPLGKYHTLDTQLQGGLYFICGTKAYKVLPRHWEGMCAISYLTPNISVVPHIAAHEPLNLGSFAHRYKRDMRAPILETRQGLFFELMRIFIPGYGVYDLELALVNMSAELAIAFNETRDALQELQVEINSVAAMTIQHRIALDLLTLQQGGLCVLLNSSCCYFLNRSGNIARDVAQIKHAVQIFHGAEKITDSDDWSWLWSWLPTGWLKSLVLTLLGIFMAIVILLCCLQCCCSMGQQLCSRSIQAISAVKVLPPTEQELAHSYLRIQQDVQEAHKEMFELMAIDL